MLRSIIENTPNALELQQGFHLFYVLELFVKDKKLDGTMSSSSDHLADVDKSDSNNPSVTTFYFYNQPEQG